MRAVVVACVILAAATAYAGPEPWAQGVPDQQQARADKLFEEGNALFGQQAHAAALAKYTEAIALWDHPRIRFNMAVTLIKLDRVLEAADALERALRFGNAPFTPALYQEALNYQGLLARQIGSIEATCSRRGAQVTLDGKPWFACPDKRETRVLAGGHVLAASAPGFVPMSRQVDVKGRATSRAQLELLSIDDVAPRYPTPRWIPWTITGGGVTIGITGLVVWVAGRGQMERFEEQHELVCATGCPTGLAGPEYAALRDQRDSAIFKGRAGIAMMIGGGALAVGGAVWALAFNRPVRIAPTVELAPTSGGMTARAGWTF